ncbi:MAG: hypothetical protein ACW98F_03255 [Candidatus Hodarchaeales archaeon]|jgi:hypothetical protein
MSQSIRVFKKRLQISQKKWTTVQGQSLRTVNMVLNILSRFNMTQRSDVFSETVKTRFDDVQGRLAFRLAESINNHILELNAFLAHFEDVIREMRKIEKSFRCDILQPAKTRAGKENNGWPHDLEIIDQAENTIREIIDMYETEIALRKQIVFEIQESVTPKMHMITAYLILWTSEIYIEPTRIHELIEEFGYVEKIYERFQTNETIDPISK